MQYRQNSLYVLLSDMVNHGDFTNIHSSINPSWNWWTYCYLALPFLLSDSWEMPCQKYLASSPQHSVPLDTDSCLKYKGSNVSNEPTEISSYRATLSSPVKPPVTLTPASEPHQMSFSFAIQKSEWDMLQAQRCSEKLHCMQTWLCNL